ncbi:MAG: rod shape-determining protein MreC [Bacteroidota bacterium]|nr:rod shape-determining protein MreC [Bacteroidota bacterium]
MRNVFLFIRKYANFLFFLVLQIVALSFLFRYNKYHEAAFMNVAGEITGNLDQRYSTVEYYFKLKKINDQLAAENARLNQMIKENYEKPDASGKLVLDTVQLDSLRQIQKFTWLDARVVGSTVSTRTNFITIHRGSNQGVRPNMGVVSPQGIVGTVVNVSENYSSVMTMLHTQYKVVVKLKNGGDRGTVEWDGMSPYYVTLKDIPKSARVQKGDSVVTSPTSSLFPGNIMVGTVEEVLDDRSSNFYTLRLKPATDFFNIEYVYVISNSQAEEQKRMEDSTHKKF